MEDAAYKDRLLALRQEISQRLANIDHDRKHIDGPLDSDSGERAVEMENDEVLDALDEASAKELRAINVALERIESGTYHNCSECGEGISDERLSAIPYTQYCINCAEKQE